MESVSVAPDATTAFAQRTGVLSRMQHLLHRYPVISPAAVLIGACIVFTIFGNGRFHQPLNIGFMLQQTAVLGALAIGQTLIVLTAGVDLAVGTAMLLTHLVMAKLFVDQGVPALLALLLGGVLGIAIGLAHGTIVTRLGLPPFIVTLGTYYIFNSLGLVYSEVKTISASDMGGENGLLLWTGKQISFGELRITVGVILTLLLYVLFAWILNNTAWGRHVYATGDDKEAARLAGINVNRVLVSVYAVAGLVYALGGWIQIGRSGSASSNAAADINLGTITAVVIGGTSLFGGRGRLWGTLIGALIVIVFQQGLSLAEVNAYWQNFAIGALILIAVSLDQWIRRVAK
jgi:fructose transport system permease protein